MMTMRTNEETAVAAEDFEQWADNLDPETTPGRHIDELRAIADATDKVAAAEARLRETVEIARALGWSWNRIAIPLGTTRQAARQRFDKPAESRR